MLFQYVVGKTTDKVPDWLANIFTKGAIINHCLVYFNSAINPVIYYIMSAQFRVSSKSYIRGNHEVAKKTKLKH